MNHKLSQRFGRGFTLIELLVVIAIIAILAAILFPVFAQAKMAAKQSTSISNQKQLLLASKMYQADHDDKYHRLRAPETANPACFTDVTCDQVNGPEDMLRPYVKSQGLFVSPIDNIRRDDCTNPQGIWYPLSYSWTHYQSGQWSETDTFGVCAYYNNQDSLTESALGAPSSTIVMYEFWSTHGYARWTSHWRWNTRQVGHDAAPSAAAPAAIPSYPKGLSFNWCGTGDGLLTMGNFNGKHVYGFSDGHVKALDRSAIMERGWTQTLGDTAGAKNLLHYSGKYVK